MEIWTGFILGLVGSIHCIGMCGPIVLALPVKDDSQLKLIMGRILYNLGRVITYSIMGALFGLFGSRLILFGLQQNLSIILGIIILIFVLTPGKIKIKLYDLSLVKKLLSNLKSQFSILDSSRTIFSLFVIGLLNGLLPCGFVYIGIAGAVSTGNWLHGTLYMMLFGLGTFPIMFAASLMGKIINQNIRKRINKLIPVLASLLAIIFILRGMNLGIPYISPKFVQNTPKMEQLDCCH
jgi:uncharacterized protein